MDNTARTVMIRDSGAVVPMIHPVSVHWTNGSGSIILNTHAASAISIGGPQDFSNKASDPGLGIGPFPAPVDDGSIPESVYMTDLPVNQPIARFHLCAWMHGDEHRMAKFWDLVDDPESFKLGRLGFRTRQTRAQFLRWWDRYTRQFFEGRDPIETFLPTKLPEGKFAGVFLPEHSKLDALPGHWASDSAPDNHWRLEAGLANVLPRWGWIVQNCKGAVWRIPGGWMFSRARDAALYKMFEPSFANDE